MGKRGTLVIPAKLRRRLELEDGCFLVLTEKGDSFELRKARLEGLTQEEEQRETHPDDAARRALAASILSGAANLGEYLAAIEEVRRMGYEADEIPHERFQG
jgi:bifunctional DNA-binding transcriptional regulator/antitoxin component of YhaV-PrlF toxin-antitoxin module